MTTVSDYQDIKSKLVHPEGFEPTTFGTGNQRSNPAELRVQNIGGTQGSHPSYGHNYNTKVLILANRGEKKLVLCCLLSTKITKKAIFGG